MYRNNKIGVIVPAYNEERFIATVINRVPGYVDYVFVIDDASADATSAIAFREAATKANIKVIKHECNGGVGKAIVTGYKSCLGEKVDIAVVMAGDGQMDPAQLPGLLEPIAENKSDYTIGNRLSCSEHMKGMSRWRRLGNLLLTWLTRVAAGNPNIYDPQNGFTAINCKVLAVLDLDNIYPRYGYCNDMLVKLSASGARISSVAMPAVYGKEKSKIRYWKYIPSVSWLLLRDFVWRITSGTKRRG